MKVRRLSKEQALSFLLTHIVVDKLHHFEMNQLNLFTLMSLASEAENRIEHEPGVIPHEIIEELAIPFIESA